MGKSASKQFNSDVLKAHNEYRQQHGVPPLKLCKKLNREAQQYSEALASTRILKHSPESSRGQCGENLAWASYDQTGKEVADRWYSEIKSYNFQQPGFTSGTGERTFEREAHGQHLLTRTQFLLYVPKNEWKGGHRTNAVIFMLGTAGSKEALLSNL
ncbi:Golgi-associated plant pathogenesis-related protein 1 isoform X4 [Erinaceus europaeus]|uniref:Golgi-associated plant pathogenesis-related protein 1 isoform X4 n=1 Tax=Erinaceus europaeus TaxID=9365 RepID=A0ABM3Y287_ERIEU|nr:Golgi-associated plant pathogenesis-related protein 1 isoform X4 [Erinaceus europaeus]